MLLVGAGLLSGTAQLSAETPDPTAPEPTEARADRDDAAEESRSGSAEESSAAPAEPIPASAFLAELAPSLGNEPGSRLHMTFEVTFMKIDVAEVEARLPAQTAALIEAIVRRGKRNDATDEEIAALLLDPDAPILLTLAYLRDADHGRFSNGIRSSMEKAAASGEITEEERVELTDLILEASAPLEENGVSKGGVFAHFIEGDVVRTVYLGPEGDVRLNTSHSNAALGRALRASWFSRESRFRKKLIRSLYE